MPIFYQGKQLTRFKEKTGGKNKSDKGGFYETSASLDSEKLRYFIKKPDKPYELFTELFAGLLLKEFMERKLIEEEYFPSLICADVVEFEDHSYGLIQPLVAFDELYKVIGTGSNNNRDRSVVLESLFGPAYYSEIIQQGKQFGLSISLMFSLLLGAHSVHSGNMVILKAMKGKSKQFGRIDWGDAFRNYALPENNENILYAYENRGFTYKQFTKDYFLNYKNIKGIFPAMAEKAKSLQSKLSEQLVVDIVTSALKRIPPNLIDKQTQAELSQYMCMDSFKSVSFGPDGHTQTFAEDMAKTMMHRLLKISELKDLTVTNTNENLYTSLLEFPPVTMKINQGESFSQSVGNLHTLLDVSGKTKTVDCTNLDIIELTKQFNGYVSRLAQFSETQGFWSPDNSQVYNIFSPHYTKEGQAEYGFAFLPQYKEGTILEHLFSIDLKTLNIYRFAPFEGPILAYCKSHPNSKWVKLQSILSKGQDIINTLSVIKNAQQLGIDDAVTEQLPNLMTFLKDFLEAEKTLDIKFPADHERAPKVTNASLFFYPMDEITLHQLTADQLATICLEELNAPTPSPLIHTILTNKDLWSKVQLALESGQFNARLDAPADKIKKLHEWHQLLAFSEQTKSKLLQENELLNTEFENLLEHVEQLTAQTKIVIEASAKSIRENQQSRESINRLKKELEQQKQQNESQVQKLVQENQKAQLQFESLLAQSKSVSLARQERLVPFLMQIQEMTTKASHLQKRHESDASIKALALSLNLRKEVQAYLNSNETDEGLALHNFKEKALACIDQSTKEVLNTHREEWKYIVGNIALGVLLIGFGYLAAIFINKQLTGNYTFFSQTDSGKQLDNMEHQIRAITVN
ncbi:LepB GTPase-activating domain-containing protein [Legionella waltersii]|uniref:Effector protein B, substrate of the Dot/Icm secretion system n=1 Tax=Legionella waltersii TaxID=66969 RepID=A0A0W1ABS5_9GAMM|nr:LepB GTPase-activating domain-containing protein [Legionella waltersii]KTD78781.1 effector protein B, substrate of the Dot/Icm secretion system [Legionella waltersii]SNV11172.1 LepB protein [Legionella waltersii]